jgi:hypothetical protein
MSPDVSKALARLLNRIADYWMETVLLMVMATLWMGTLVLVAVYR